MSEMKEQTTEEQKAEMQKPASQKPKEQEMTFLESLWDLAKTFFTCLIIVMLFVNFVARPIHVEGRSMYPTLESGSIGFANVFGRKFMTLERFDIAIIHVENPDEYIVKRIIGMPHETLEYHDDMLYINGEPVEQPFLDTDYRKSYEDQFTTDIEPITLGEDEYYCLGDNRPVSRDSRYYGPFKGSRIIAKGAFIFFPFNEFGIRSW